MYLRFKATPAGAGMASAPLLLLSELCSQQHRDPLLDVEFILLKQMNDLTNPSRRS